MVLIPFILIPDTNYPVLQGNYCLHLNLIMCQECCRSIQTKGYLSRRVGRGLYHWRHTIKRVGWCTVKSFTKCPKGTLRDGCTLEAEVSVQLGWWAVRPGAGTVEQRKQWKERGMGPAKGRLVTHFEVYGSPAGAVVKTPPASALAGDTKTLSLIPGSGRSPGGGHSNPLQYSCLENPMDRGA